MLFQFLEEEVILPDMVFPAVGIRSAGRTVSLCVQDCDTWGYAARNPHPGPHGASGSVSGGESGLDAVRCCQTIPEK